MIKIRILYKGIRNPNLEKKIVDIASSCYGIKSGEWGYFENSFSCLFVFKKELQSIHFKDSLKKEFQFDFNKIQIFLE